MQSHKQSPDYFRAGLRDYEFQHRFSNVFPDLARAITPNYVKSESLSVADVRHQPFDETEAVSLSFRAETIHGKLIDGEDAACIPDVLRLTARASRRSLIPAFLTAAANIFGEPLERIALKAAVL